MLLFTLAPGRRLPTPELGQDASKVGLLMNSSKSNIVVRAEYTTVNTPIYVDQQRLEEVTQFTNIGSVVTAEELHQDVN